MDKYLDICTGVAQKIERGYLTSALTNERGKIFGVIKDCSISAWYNEGKSFSWSDVFVDGNSVTIVRRGMLLVEPTDEELSALHKQSKLNLHAND